MSRRAACRWCGKCENCRTATANKRYHREYQNNRQRKRLYSNIPMPWPKDYFQFEVFRGCPLGKCRYSPSVVN